MEFYVTNVVFNAILFALYLRYNIYNSYKIH